MQRDDSLIAYWAFNEGKGKSVLDHVSGQNDAISYVFNEAKDKPSSDPLWTKGMNGPGLLFDGYSTWVTRKADQFPQLTQSFTVEAWVAPRCYEEGDERRLSAFVNQHDREAAQGFVLGMYRHGTWSMQVGVAGEWLEVWAEKDAVLLKDQWSYITSTYDAAKGQMALYLNAREVGLLTVPNHQVDQGITPCFEDLLIGKNNHSAITNEIFDANMFCGMIDELKIYNRARTVEEINADFQAYVQLFEDGMLPKPDMTPKRSRYDGDRHRPQYHFLPPEHWMNEPHAPLFFNGQYHLFYQNNPQGPYIHQLHWGHAVSDDLVHWRDLPVAIAPEADAVDPDGCWSGCSVIDNDGIPALIYTAGDFTQNPSQQMGLARSTYSQDGDLDLKQWVKHEQPIVVQEENLGGAEKGTAWFGQFRDPFIWKDENVWYQIIGSGIRNGEEYIGGTALLYTSEDLIQWTYRKPLIVGDYVKYPTTGQVWELPVLLPIGKDQKGKEKHVFLINPWYDFHNEHNVKHVWYWIGTWDREGYSFIPDDEEPQLTDVGEHFTGPSGLVDPKGRSLVFSIAQGKRTKQNDYYSGWAHNAGLPTHLYLREDGRLGVEPVEELASLRVQSLLNYEGRMDLDEANAMLSSVCGDCLEIELVIDSASFSEAGIKVRRSESGQEETLLFYKNDTQEFLVDRSLSSLATDVGKGVQGGKVDLADEDLKLHIYLDRSMVEAYLNGLKGLTTRVYPTREDAVGLQLWSSSDPQQLRILTLKVWELGSAF